MTTITPTQPTASLAVYPMAEMFARLGVVQRQLARSAGLSKSAVGRIAKGVWPSTDAAAARESLAAALVRHGATEADIETVFAMPIDTGKKVGPDGLHPAEAVSPEEPVDPQKEETMLLQNQAVSKAALSHFNLHRSPFFDDVQESDDVFQSQSIRYARASLLDCAEHHGFMALVGESGAGKSILAEDLEQRIIDASKPIRVIRPYVLAMEDTDTKGKTLKSGAIAEAVIRALNPQVTVRSSPEARFAQLHELLRTSARGGNRHLLLIEEAHCLPVQTLKHLKRWLELKDGLRRLIGVAMIGQPELRHRLASGAAEVREVAQRCEVIELAPLDNDLEAYLSHKFARAGVKTDKVLAADACDAIRHRLIYKPRGGKPGDARSMCYPLVVNNLVSRAMNQAADTGWPLVDAQVIARC